MVLEKKKKKFLHLNKAMVKNEKLISRVNNFREEEYKKVFEAESVMIVTGYFWKE